MHIFAHMLAYADILIHKLYTLKERWHTLEYADAPKDFCACSKFVRVCERLKFTLVIR